MCDWRVRKAEDSEVELYIEWAEKEGWVMSPEIIRDFHKQFPAGWFLGELNSKGESNFGESSTVVGLLHCIKYRVGIGFIGYLIVDSECRGQGYGDKLFQFVLDNFIFNDDDGPPAKAAGLFAMPDAEEFYKRSGFETKGFVSRFKGKVNPNLLKISGSCVKDGENGVSGRVSRMTESDLEEVALLDELYSLAYRPGFWRNSVREEISLGKGLGLVYRGQSGKMEGLGMIRRIPQGFRLGPLYANDIEVIEALVKRLLPAITRHDTVVIDVHCGNTEACEWYKTLGLQEVLKTCYMWKGDFTLEQEKVNRTYAMASLDFH